MATFNLELRVRTHGSILTWRIYLEDSTNESYRVRDWYQHPDGYRVKKLPNYTIRDSSLEVFAGCQGIDGGNVNCEVIINGVPRTKKVISKPTDRRFATSSYSVTQQLPV